MQIRHDQNPYSIIPEISPGSEAGGTNPAGGRLRDRIIRAEPFQALCFGHVPAINVGIIAHFVVSFVRSDGRGPIHLRPPGHPGAYLDNRFADSDFRYRQPFRAAARRKPAYQAPESRKSEHIQMGGDLDKAYPKRAIHARTVFHRFPLFAFRLQPFYV
ncbi:hypothetical protein D3C77_509090 [compost metagenome]